jgi:hypothetical protein
VTVLAALLAAIAGLFAATSRDVGRSAAVSELTPSPQPAADSKPTPAPEPEGVTMPPGTTAVTLRFELHQLSAQYLGPGSRVDILADARFQDKRIGFPLMVRVFVVRVDRAVSDIPAECDIVFAVNQQQAQLIELAKSRDCRLQCLIRAAVREEDYRGYDIDAVLKFLTELEPDTIPPPRLKSVE